MNQKSTVYPKPRGKPEGAVQQNPSEHKYPTTTPDGILGAVADFLNVPEAKPGKESQPSTAGPKLSKEDLASIESFKQKFRDGKWSGNIHEYPDQLAHAQRRALIVAIRYSRNPPDTLNGTYADAHKISKLLVDKFGYSNGDICVLSDINRVSNGKIGPNLYPSKENIEKGLGWLSGNTQAGDFRFLYYAGHGCRRIEASPGVHCEGIIPADVEYGNYARCNDCVCELKDNPDAQTLDPNSVVWDYAINKILAESLGDGTNLTVILDCCHSGGTLGKSFINGNDVLSENGFNFARGNTPSHISGSSGTSSSSSMSMNGNLLYLPNRVDVEESNKDSAVGDVSKIGFSTNEEVVARSSHVNMPGLGTGPRIIADTNGTPPDACIVNCYPHRQCPSDIQDFKPRCRVLCWAACRKYEGSYEGKKGGVFTEAFVDYLNERPDSTYRQLNRRIKERFLEPIGTKEGRPINQNPQLYASANMGKREGPSNRFEDKVEL